MVHYIEKVWISTGFSEWDCWKPKFHLGFHLPSDAILCCVVVKAVAQILLYQAEGRVGCKPSHPSAYNLPSKEESKDGLEPDHTLLYYSVYVNSPCILSFCRQKVGFETVQTLKTVWTSLSEVKRCEKGLGAFNIPHWCIHLIQGAWSKPPTLRIIPPETRRFQRDLGTLNMLHLRLQKLQRAWRKPSAFILIPPEPQGGQRPSSRLQKPWRKKPQTSYWAHQRSRESRRLHWASRSSGGLRIRPQSSDHTHKSSTGHRGLGQACRISRGFRTRLIQPDQACSLSPQKLNPTSISHQFPLCKKGYLWAPKIGNMLYRDSD